MKLKIKIIAIIIPTTNSSMSGDPDNEISTFKVGRHSSVGTHEAYHFNGTVDEVRIYNKVIY